MKVNVVKPDSVPSTSRGRFTIFLAGSIEMGAAENWQDKFADRLKNQQLDFEVTLFNPRRDNWDSSWTQNKNDKNFSDQVWWELNHLDWCDSIVMYFDPNTKSPVSLLELGLYAKTRKLIVICPDGFWRKGNVEIVCDKEDIPLYNSMNEAFESVINLIRIGKIKR